jgi:hypothetical protein
VVIKLNRIIFLSIISRAHKIPASCGSSGYKFPVSHGSNLLVLKHYENFRGICCERTCGSHELLTENLSYLNTVLNGLSTVV